MARSPLPARRRILLTAAVVCGVALVPSPGRAAPEDPGTSTEAAALVAARAHDLEVVSEQVNTAAEQLSALQAAAEEAARQVADARAAVTGARDQVRSVARQAYTSSQAGALDALLSSDSPSQVLDRLALLNTVAGYRTEVLDTAQHATEDAQEARTVADRAAADASAQLDRVTAQQQDLDHQIAVYRAAYDRLSAQEQAASRAAAERAAAQERAAQEQAAQEQAAQEQAAPAPSSSGAPDRSTQAAPQAPSPAPAPAAAGSSAAQTAVSTALAQVGKPYVWGAAGPGSYDCSGLVQYAYRAAGVSLPHSSSMQSTMGTPVARSALQPGDLIFFYSPVSHVAMYIGNGQMVHASTAGEPVKVVSVDAMPSYNSARRISG